MIREKKVSCFKGSDSSLYLMESSFRACLYVQVVFTPGFLTWPGPIYRKSSCHPRNHSMTHYWPTTSPSCVTCCGVSSIVNCTRAPECWPMQFTQEIWSAPKSPKTGGCGKCYLHWCDLSPSPRLENNGWLLEANKYGFRVVSHDCLFLESRSAWLTDAHKNCAKEWNFMVWGKSCNKNHVVDVSINQKVAFSGLPRTSPSSYVAPWGVGGHRGRKW